MAVTKIWQVKGSLADVVKYAGNPEKTRTHDLARVVGYAADEYKTLDENEQFYAVTGVNCNAKTALAEMLADAGTVRQNRRQCGLPRVPKLQNRRGYAGAMSQARR